MEKRDGFDLCYLAKSTGQSVSIKSSYIVFFTKMQKGQNPKMRFALVEKGWSINHRAVVMVSKAWV
jgi:hypothetical protein